MNKHHRHAIKYPTNKCWKSNIQYSNSFQEKYHQASLFKQNYIHSRNFGINLTKSYAFSDDNIYSQLFINDDDELQRQYLEIYLHRLLSVQTITNLLYKNLMPPQDINAILMLQPVSSKNASND